MKLLIALPLCIASATFTTRLSPAQEAAAPEQETAAPVQDATSGLQPSPEHLKRWLYKDGKVDGEVAFEIYLRGRDDIPVIKVSLEEWKLLADSVRSLGTIQDEGQFVTKQLDELLQQKTILLAFYDELPEVNKRVDEIQRQLRRGMSFERAARLFSMDKNSGSTGGDFGMYRHGQLFYPLEPLAWQLEVGEVKPFITRFAVYITKIVEHKAGVNEVLDKVKLQVIWLGFSERLTGKLRTQINRLIAVRTDHERFKELIPPAYRDTAITQFGPTDIAPMGKPETMLTHFSDRDEFHRKQSQPVPIVGAQPRGANRGSGSNRKPANNGGDEEE